MIATIPSFERPHYLESRRFHGHEQRIEEHQARIALGMAREREIDASIDREIVAMIRASRAKPLRWICADDGNRWHGIKKAAEGLKVGRSAVSNGVNGYCRVKDRVIWYEDAGPHRMLKSRGIVRLRDNLAFGSIVDAIPVASGHPEYNLEFMRLSRAIARGKPYRGELYARAADRVLAFRTEANDVSTLAKAV